MPTRSWAKAAVLVLALAAGPPALAAGRRAAPATLSVTVEGRALLVPVALDAASVSPRDHAVKVLGVRDGVALVVDSYASRPQGLSRCQAGYERWVRLIDVAARRERWSKLAESCLKNVEPGDPLAAWAADGRSVAVNLVSEPSVRVSLRSGGKVDVAPQGS